VLITNEILKWAITLTATIALVLMIVSMFPYVYHFDYQYTIQDRLERDPNLVAACQYEQWLNTTHQTLVTTGDSIVYEDKSDVNWVCYYRDNHTTIQKIGSFHDTFSAMWYIWYYYDNGRFASIIWVKK